MSRSDNEKAKTPSKVFLEWNGTKGGFHYFDKSKGEKGEKVHVPLPLNFMVLDTLVTIKGFSDSTQSGFWSNEIKSKNLSKGILVVRNKSGIVAQGTYSEIMANKATTGAKFCQSVYIAFKMNGESIMGNIQMKGAALKAWIDFGKVTDIYKDAITVATMKDGKKGVTKYKIPVFEKVPADKMAEEKAIEMDKELKAYLDLYFDNNQAEETTEEVTPNSQ